MYTQRDTTSLLLWGGHRAIVPQMCPAVSSCAHIPLPHRCACTRSREQGHTYCFISEDHGAKGLCGGIRKLGLPQLLLLGTYNPFIPSRQIKVRAYIKGQKPAVNASPRSRLAQANAKRETPPRLCQGSLCCHRIYASFLPKQKITSPREETPLAKNPTSLQDSCKLR